MLATEANRGDILAQKAFDLIVTVPDPTAAKGVISHFFLPESTIITRSRYHMASQGLEGMEANQVIDDGNTMGGVLAREVMESIRDVNRNAMGCALAGEKP